jgi:choline kinase
MKKEGGKHLASFEAAIILAGGRNERMGAIEIPKALLPLNRHDPESPCFLSRHVKYLRHYGVGEIIVVVREQSAVDFRQKVDGSVQITFTYADSSTGRAGGSALSLAAGLDALAQNSRQLKSVLVMDADTLYERRLIGEIASAEMKSCIFISPNESGDSEEICVYAFPSREPVLLGKNIPKSVSENLISLGESLGFILLTGREIQLARDIITWITGRGTGSRLYGLAGPSAEHEDVWQRMFAFKCLRASCISKELIFSECDTQEDYNRIVEEIYPTICILDQE